jgi:hypothetical protein
MVADRQGGCFPLERGGIGVLALRWALKPPKELASSRVVHDSGYHDVTKMS